MSQIVQIDFTAQIWKEVLLETGYELRQGAWVSPPWIALERHSAAIGISGRSNSQSLFCCTTV